MWAMTTHNILASLKKKGFRITNIRKTLADILFRSKRPLTVTDLAAEIEKRGLMANKTTLYREVEFFREQGFIHELKINEKSKSYEWAADHHHHLVCRSCRSIERVELKELEELFPRVEERLKRSTHFAQIDHTLEFFGLCAACI